MFLAGGAGQNMIGFSFPACGRGNAARPVLAGEKKTSAQRNAVRWFCFVGLLRPILRVGGADGPLDLGQVGQNVLTEEGQVGLLPRT